MGRSLCHRPSCPSSTSCPVIWESLHFSGNGGGRIPDYNAPPPYAVSPTAAPGGGKEEKRYNSDYGFTNGHRYVCSKLPAMSRKHSFCRAPPAFGNRGLRFFYHFFISSPSQILLVVDSSVGLATAARLRRRASPPAAAADGRASVQPPPPAAAPQIFHIFLFLPKGTTSLV